VGAAPKCVQSDSYYCLSFQLQQVKYGINSCNLSANNQSEIKFTIACRRPAGSTEEDCKLILIAGKDNSPLKELQFSIDQPNPDFQNHEGYIEVPDAIDPSIPNSPVTRKFLVKYVGTKKTLITVHCKFRHGDSVNECEMCTSHQAAIILDLG